MAEQLSMASPEDDDICRGDGRGLFLPLFSNENTWNNTLRVFLYLFGLLYCFMGVAIIADVFMAAIEKITSKKRRIPDKETGKLVTKPVWNPTVANLTLMALGSSAPEILLNVIFIFADGYFQEGLGPSTIVGSAAFNLFCISAVCVISIPAGETRIIKELPVYCVTAFFSIFAYIWLLFILMVVSPNIVEPWEGIVTFLFFPLLVIIAYIADRGYLTPAAFQKDEKDDKKFLTDDISKEELAAMETEIRMRHGNQLTDAQVLRLMEAEHQAPKSRAHYRVKANREMTGGRRVDHTRTIDPLYNVMPTVGTCDDRDAVDKRKLAIVEFIAHKYTVLESANTVKLPVTRRGNLDVVATVNYKTREGSAKAVSDYVHTEGQLTFQPGETTMCIEVPIIDDDSHEEQEDFYVELSLGDDNTTSTLLGENFLTVTIIDDDDPGVLSFEQTDISVTEGPEDKIVTVKVVRKGGGSGQIKCKYGSQDVSAFAGRDYEQFGGTLTFEAGQMSASFEVTIKSKGRYETSEQFRIVLEDVSGGAKFDATTDGGEESCILYVTITPDEQNRERIDRIMSNLRVNWDRASLGSSNWKDQFRAAIFVNGGDDEEGDVSITDYILHGLNMPWKLLCAFVPPTDFLDGWVCFCSSLMVIGLVTAVIGDMAGLLGCCMFGPGNDGITAITFVALGTSLPDTFASKTAAQQDPYADASIGNVTGSNSVNVFLGLGLPWMIASIYWASSGPNEKWVALYWDKEWARDFRDGALAVEDPGLGMSVAVFTVCGIICMGVLLLRRKFCGGELGGPRHLAIATACFFVFLWLVFIVMYIVMKE